MNDTAASEFQLYPAIDVRDGAVVRLHQGDYDRQTRYPLSPLDQAHAYANSGARWLHLVDLDAARAGGYTLAPLLRRLKVQTPLQVQTGGGVRSADDVATLLDAGADRVVIGSLAVRAPGTVADWIQRFGPQRITVALDARRDAKGAWRLPVAGWTRDSDAELPSLLHHYASCALRHLLCTDIDRDGALTGPNLELCAMIRAEAPALALQASGGVRALGDIEATRSLGCAGVVLGKALLERRFDLASALAAVTSARAAPC